jgi:hypothetical protein
VIRKNTISIVICNWAYVHILVNDIFRPAAFSNWNLFPEVSNGEVMGLYFGRLEEKIL